MIVALLVAVLTAPLLSWGVSQFVLLPQMRAAIAEATPEVGGKGVSSLRESTGAGASNGATGAQGANGHSYRFDGLVVNLAGTMGTRYLKTTFIVSGEDPSLHATFAAREVPLRDTALSVLSSLTLADLEEVGARNFIRERLVRSFNQTLGETVAEQIYFLDFVVQ